MGALRVFESVNVILQGEPANETSVFPEPGVQMLSY